MSKYHSEEDDVELIRASVIPVQTVEQLQEVEKLAFLIRSIQVVQGNYIMNEFTLDSMKKIHRHLFQDIYRFAGEIRNVQLMKDDTRFCQVQFIESYATSLFAEMNSEHEWDKLDIAAKRMAYFKSELNMLHPFREGNGRTIRLFLQAYANSKGFEWNYTISTRDEYMKAVIQSVTDLDLLIQYFMKYLQKKTS